MNTTARPIGQSGSRVFASASAFVVALVALVAPAATSSAAALRGPHHEAQQVQEALSVIIWTQNGNQYTVSGLTAASTVLDLKVAFADQQGLPPCAQVLVYQGVAMADPQSLGFYGVTGGVSIDLVTRYPNCH